MCWAVGILLLPLGDFQNLIYHSIKDFFLIFSLILPSFFQLHGFVPHGSSVLIFSPIQRLILLFLPVYNIAARYLCISYRERQVFKYILCSSLLPHFGRKLPCTQLLFRLPEPHRQKASSFAVINSVCCSICTSGWVVLVCASVPCSAWCSQWSLVSGKMQFWFFFIKVEGCSFILPTSQ